MRITTQETDIDQPVIKHIEIDVAFCVWFLEISETERGDYDTADLCRFCCKPDCKSRAAPTHGRVADFLTCLDYFTGLRRDYEI